MMGLEYLTWVLFTGLCSFIAIRLYWIYQRHRYHLFWRTPGARQYIFVAVLLLCAMAAVLALRGPTLYLFPLAIAIYLLCALAAVKISERGIFAHGWMARWLDIQRVHYLPEKKCYLVVTSQRWRRLRCEVPTPYENQFRKMLALQKIMLVQEGQPAAPAPDFATAH